MFGPIHASACSMFATMLRWVSIAPLATPVVPPVYCRKAMSSGPMSTLRERRARAALQRVVEADRVRNRVRRHHLLDVAHDEIGDHAISGNRACRRCPCRSRACTASSPSTSATRVREIVEHDDRAAPESSSWCFSSRARVQRIGVDHASGRRAGRAMIAIGYCSTFGSMIATRSPLASFRSLRRNAANVALSASSSP